MGVMDKVKKILFDEEIEEVPVNEELPSKPNKKVMRNTGFIDYHNEEESETEPKIENKIEDDDVIKEIVVPKDEPKPFNFPVDFDFEPEIHSRTQSYDLEEKEEIEERPSRFSESVYNEPVKPNYEERDYRKILEEKPEREEKKPFKVTPIISPVYGILDKNYRPEEVVVRQEVPKENKPKKRTFGPVSFNDEPLPMPKRNKEELGETSLKEDLVEINTTITDLINDTITPEEVKNFSGPSIEDAYLEHNSIEDAFEETSELEQINENDERFETRVEETSLDNEIIEETLEDEASEEVPTHDISEALTSELEEEPQIDIDEILDNAEDELTDTIETDLFNLIDSMYKSDDSEDE